MKYLSKISDGLVKRIDDILHQHFTALRGKLADENNMIFKSHENWYIRSTRGIEIHYKDGVYGYAGVVGSKILTTDAYLLERGGHAFLRDYSPWDSDNSDIPDFVKKVSPTGIIENEDVPNVIIAYFNRYGHFHVVTYDISPMMYKDNGIFTPLDNASICRDNFPEDRVILTRNAASHLRIGEIGHRRLREKMLGVLDTMQCDIEAAAAEVKALNTLNSKEYADAFLGKNLLAGNTAEICIYDFKPEESIQSEELQDEQWLVRHAQSRKAYENECFQEWEDEVEKVQEIVQKFNGNLEVDGLSLAEYLKNIKESHQIRPHRAHIRITMPGQEELRKLTEIIESLKDYCQKYHPVLLKELRSSQE